MEILLLFLARFLLGELYGFPPSIIFLIILLIIIHNSLSNPIHFLRISNSFRAYYIAISLLLLISLFNKDLDSILNILILFTLPFISFKSQKYFKYITYFVIISSIIYSISIFIDFNIYVNRSHNYLLLGRGILTCQVFLLFTNNFKFKYHKLLKLLVSFLFLSSLAIMHGRLNAIVSLLLIFLFFLKNYKYSWLFLSLIGVFATSIIVNFISTLNIGTIKRLINDQDSISERTGLYHSAFDELLNVQNLFFGGGLDFSNEIAMNTVGYPYLHNLPLELLLDFGLFSVPFLLIWGFMLFRSSKIIFFRKEILLPVLLFVETFQFLKSFEFNQSISLFLIITLLINEKNEL